MSMLKPLNRTLEMGEWCGFVLNSSSLKLVKENPIPEQNINFTKMDLFPGFSFASDTTQAWLGPVTYPL